MDRPSRRIAVGCFQEFALSFEFSEARIPMPMSFISVSLVSMPLDKKWPHPHPRTPRTMEMTLRASTPRLLELRRFAARCYLLGRKCNRPGYAGIGDVF
jgi:hypothetical protein